MRKSDSIYVETLREYADFFDMSLRDANRLFGKFLGLNYREAKEQLNPFQRAFCIGLYRTTKLKGACRMAQNSREGWKGRAMELGSPSHLVDRESGAEPPR